MCLACVRDLLRLSTLIVLLCPLDYCFFPNPSPLVTGIPELLATGSNIAIDDFLLCTVGKAY